MTILTKDKIISISDLTLNANEIINNLPETGDKYIFIHNKPKAVIVDFNWFENVSKKFDKHGLEYTNIDDYEKNAIYKYSKNKEKGKLELVEAFSFLDSIK